MTSRSKITDADWEGHKSTIHQLYIVENKTLATVREKMASEYNFHATTSQYTTRFSVWGFQKGFRPETWEGISRSLKKRKLAPSNVEVFINGEVIPEKKLKKGILRYDLPTMRLCMQSRATTPDGVVIRPKHRQLKFELPSYEFLPILQETFQLVCGWEHASPPPSTLLDDAFDDMGALVEATESDGETLDLIHSLHCRSQTRPQSERCRVMLFLTPVDTYIGALFSIPPYRTLSQVNSILLNRLRPFFIESLTHDLQTVVEQLLDSKSKTRTQVLMFITVFLISNGHLIYGEEDVDAAVQLLYVQGIWIRKRSSRSYSG
ncbi:hypothetical protein A1O3_04291 [Capronia epimyces CBS 606.96]|uniref:Clr5 domain-containing protein n=1 Tax=Capronia epimyces CBS 606.96 TaxID=1182542 RepID=W9Y3H1_9EURO|nr:uncharacterized protein A1O3_04291 [Capronia epimyces CBS 606.96]EXJ87332.1 hypothetical protein A1O3_04291 [Capronia epimyces CBS 606.96]